jgi:ribulose-5-phosphate 4-epimerase/fuculose-1-phosphate aldolase
MMGKSNLRPNMDNWEERVDLAAAFRWTVRLNMHEAVANHFSFAINEDGTKFLMNPNQMHFSRVKASNLIVVDANDPTALEGPMLQTQRPGVCTGGYTDTANMPDV